MPFSLALSVIVDLRDEQSSDISEHNRYHLHAPKLLEVDAELTKIVQALNCYLAQGLSVLVDAWICSTTRTTFDNCGIGQATFRGARTSYTPEDR